MVDAVLRSGVDFNSMTITLLVKHYFEDDRRERGQHLVKVIDVLRARGANWNEDTFAELLKWVKFPSERAILDYFLENNCPRAADALANYINASSGRHKQRRTLLEFFRNYGITVQLY